MSNKINCIVLHRIVKDNVTFFEDIELPNFEYLVNIVREKTIITNEIKSINSDSYILTFDDGNKSDFEIVLPILNKFKLKAIFFIVPSFVGKEDYLTWEQIKVLKENGMEIGSHSLTHPNFTNLNKDEKITEIMESKRIIESKLNSKIHSFAFPFGFFDKESENIVLSSGYSFCFNSMHGLNGTSSKVLKRNSLNSSSNKINIDNTLNPGNKTLLLWYLEDFIKSKLKYIFGNRYNLLRNWILDH